MDPITAIGLAGSLVGLAGAAIETSVALYKFCDAVATAKKEIEQLARELANFSNTSTALSEVIKTHETLLEPKLLADADANRQECDYIIQDIKAGLGKLDAQAVTIFDRAKWVFRKDVVACQLAKLERAKACLTLMGVILNLSATLSVGRSPKSSQEHVVDVHRQYQRATVFVVVTQKAFEDVDELEAKLQETSSNSVDRATRRLEETFLAETTLAEVLAPPAPAGHHNLIEAAPKISVQSNGNSDDDPVHRSRALMTNQAPQIVRQLLLGWTNVEDISDLPEAARYAEQVVVEDILQEKEATPPTPSKRSPTAPQTILKLDVPLPILSDVSGVPDNATPSFEQLRKDNSLSNNHRSPSIDEEVKLFPGFEAREDNLGRRYWVDYNKKTTSWLPPSKTELFNSGGPESVKWPDFIVY